MVDRAPAFSSRRGDIPDYARAANRQALEKEEYEARYRHMQLQKKNETAGLVDLGDGMAGSGYVLRSRVIPRTDSHTEAPISHEDARHLYSERGVVFHPSGPKPAVESASVRSAPAASARVSAKTRPGSLGALLAGIESGSTKPPRPPTAAVARVETLDEFLASSAAKTTRPPAPAASTSAFKHTYPDPDVDEPQCLNPASKCKDLQQRFRRLDKEHKALDRAFAESSQENAELQEQLSETRKQMKEWKNYGVEQRTNAEENMSAFQELKDKAISKIDALEADHAEEVKALKAEIKSLKAQPKVMSPLSTTGADSKMQQGMIIALRQKLDECYDALELLEGQRDDLADVLLNHTHLKGNQDVIRKVEEMKRLQMPTRGILDALSKFEAGASHGTAGASFRSPVASKGGSRTEIDSTMITPPPKPRRNLFGKEDGVSATAADSDAESDSAASPTAAPSAAPRAQPPPPPPPLPTSSKSAPAAVAVKPTGRKSALDVAKESAEIAGHDVSGLETKASLLGAIRDGFATRKAGKTSDQIDEEMRKAREAKAKEREAGEVAAAAAARTARGRRTGSTPGPPTAGTTDPTTSRPSMAALLAAGAKMIGSSISGLGGIRDSTEDNDDEWVDDDKVGAASSSRVPYAVKVQGEQSLLNLDGKPLLDEHGQPIADVWVSPDGKQVPLLNLDAFMNHTAESVTDYLDPHTLPPGIPYKCLRNTYGDSAKPLTDRELWSAGVSLLANSNTSNETRKGYGIMFNPNLTEDALRRNFPKAAFWKLFVTNKVRQSMSEQDWDNLVAGDEFWGFVDGNK